jgi:cytoskeletal protein RodZ
VKQRIRSISLLATLAVAIGVISWGSVLYAQNTPAAPPDQQTPSSQQTPNTTPPPDTTPSQQQSPDTTAPPSSQQPPRGGTPDSSATSDATDSQTFSGTVEKQGDKYVLKDDTGKVYDIDHQDEVKKFDGKRVRVKGTLDETGKKILVK